MRGMEIQHDLSGSMKALYWLSPIAVIVSHLLSSLVSFILLEEPPKVGRSRLVRLTITTLMATVFASFVAQAILYTLRSNSHPEWKLPEAIVIYLMLSGLVWGVLSVKLFETEKPSWRAYGLPWMLGCVLEGLILRQDGAWEYVDVYDSQITRVKMIRAMALVFLCGLYCLPEGLRVAKIEGSMSTKPLSTPKSAPSPGKAFTEDIPETEPAVQTDSDSECEESYFSGTKEERARREQQLKASGSWLAYLMDFQMLLPLLWPRGNIKLQLCLLSSFLEMFAQRVWNILIPTQLGLLTDGLANSAGSGQLPYKPLLLWMLYTFLSSSSGLSLLWSSLGSHAYQYAYKTISTTAFMHVMFLDMEYHSNKKSGELIMGLSQGQSVYGLLHYVLIHALPVFVDMGIAIVYVIYLFDIYTAYLLVVSGLVYVWVGSKLDAWVVNQRKGTNKKSRDESQILNESIGNWQTVSHFHREAYECERYTEAVDESNKAEREANLTNTVSSAIQGFVAISSRLAVASLAAHRVVQGTVPLGNFVTLMSYWSTIEAPMSGATYAFRYVSRTLTDAETLLDLFRRKATVFDIPDATSLQISSGSVEFRNVGFAYDPRKPTLSGISFEVKGGQTVALVGETGGGKSTILKLLYRYYDVVGGSILIDGQDIRRVTLDSLRESFGMVPQDPSLFNTSIMENVRYARLEATDDEVHDACRAAAIHDKILTFPDGYKSKVGERGVKLSGGELQRVAIARAILRNPHIVLLDEATSMVDAETEATIQQAFKKLTSGRTTFVVAHRLSTIQNADMILVIHDGRIIERGTHAELFAQKGKYLSLWSRQFSKGSAARPTADTSQEAEDGQ